MEQQIHFCTTSDGVSIAYATLGEGPPLVYATGWPGHLAAEWEKPVSREFVEELGRGSTLIRYDMRGSGLSDHDVPDLSLESFVKDLEAVVDHLALEQFALLSLGFLAGPIAMTYAAAHAERVSRLILSSGYLRGADVTTPERGRAMVDYIANYGFPLSIPGADLEKGNLEEWQDVARLQRLAAPREVQAAVARAMLSADVSGLADRLSMPTLVLHGRMDQVVPFALGRDLAARLPNANFVPFEGSSAAPWTEREVLIPQIHRVLGVGATAETPEAAPLTGIPLTILFTDITSSTALTQRLGDAKAQEVVHAHNNIVREALKAHGGSEIKHTGDGIMASFLSASRALECAIAIQRGVATYNRGEAAGGPDPRPPTRDPLSVHVGLNAGEPVAEDADLFGIAVQLARRICDQAAEGQILVSNVVRELAAGKGFLFSDRGETALRGFEEPVRLYEVRWREAG